MAQNTVQVSIRVRNDSSTNWSDPSKNPILATGEFGLETDTLKLKIGDGVRNWNSLPYITSSGGGDISFDSTYFTTDQSGNLTFVASFLNSLIQKDSNGIVNDLQVDTPVANADATNKQYVDTAISTAVNNANHLRREIVSTNLPMDGDADENTIYMVLDPTSPQDGDRYKEYMKIGGKLVLIGDTSINIRKLLSSVSPTAGNVVSIADNGSLVDSGYEATRLDIATTTHLGVVKSGTGALGDGGTGIDRVVVDNSGFMTLSHVSTSLLYVPTGDSLILNGGNAG